jgi:single-strand DNA-binding protein
LNLCSFLFTAHFLGHRFRLIPAPLQLRGFCFLGSSLETLGTLQECSRSLWEQKPSLLDAPRKWGKKGEVKMHNSIQIIGNLGRDPEQRETRATGAQFAVMSVATRRSWKNAQGEWESRTDWHRVVCFNRLNDAAARLRRGDQVVIIGSLVSSKYEREVSKGKKPTTVKLTSWQIRADTLRKLNRAVKEPEAVVSGSSEEASAAPF